MPIEKLDEFAKNGQKSTEGIILENGFPQEEKPARQWFNYILNSQAVKSNELIDEFNIIQQDTLDIQDSLDLVKFDTGITATPKLPNGVERPLASKLSDVVSVLDFYNVLISYETALTNALNSGAKEVYIPADTTITINDRIEITNNTLERIYGGGKLLFANGSRLTVKNNLIPITPSTGNKYSNSVRLSFEDTTPLEKDDVLIVWNPIANSLSNYRDYRDGYMAKVAGFGADGQVRLYGKTPKINSSSVECYYLKKRHFSLEDIEIGITYPEEGIRNTHIILQGLTNVKVKNLKSPTMEVYVGIQIDKCFDAKVFDLTNSANANNGYPIMISNTQNYIIHNCHMTSSRHAIALGGNSEIGSVPSRNGIISNCILSNDPYDGDDVVIVGVGAGDAHGNVVNLMYTNCIFNMGVQWGGKDCSIYNSIIYSMEFYDTGRTVAAGEAFGGVFNLVDCNLFISRTNETGSREAIIKMNCPERSEEMVVNIKNLTVRWEEDTLPASTIIPFFAIYDSNTSAKLTINVDNITEMGSLVKKNASIVRINRDIPNESAPVFVSITNADNMNFASYASSSYVSTGIKYRISGIGGTISLPIPSRDDPNPLDSSEVAITLPTTYPRPPFGQVATFENYTNGSNGWLVRSRTTTNDVKIKARCLDATSVLPNATSYKVHWSVGLKEF